MATAFQDDAFQVDAFQIDTITPPTPDTGGSIGRRVDLPPRLRPPLVTLHGLSRLPAFGAHGAISFEVFALMGIATGTAFESSGLVGITPPSVRMSGIAVGDPFQSIAQFTVTMRKRR